MIPTKRLKMTDINTILNHPNNQDPAFVANLGVKQIPLPPYNKATLKHLPRSHLDIIGSAWQIPPLLDPNSRRNFN